MPPQPTMVGGYDEELPNDLVSLREIRNAIREPAAILRWKKRFWCIGGHGRASQPTKGIAR
jgi:hypothetical protein